MLKFQGSVFTKDINKAMLISDAMETGTVQINSAPARGPDHFPFQVNKHINNVVFGMKDQMHLVGNWTKMRACGFTGS